jgi:hypothetical protein
MTTLAKTPEETRHFFFDFSQQPEIEDDFDRLTGTPTIVATPRVPGNSLTLGTPYIVTGQPVVGIEISGGVLGSTFDLICTVNTATGTVLSGSGAMVIRRDV